MTAPRPQPRKLPKAYAVDDPTVQDLARFMRNTPLSNGMFAPLPEGFCPPVAQAVLNWVQGIAWDEQGKKYVSVREHMVTPEGHDVDYQELSPGVHKLTHRPTGLYSIDTDIDKAWGDLREKVKRHA